LKIDRYETRCKECIGIGVECPHGYYAGKVQCDVCHYFYVLSGPCCRPVDTCPECGGNVTYLEELLP
jgi:hypothetical protein